MEGDVQMNVEKKVDDLYLKYRQQVLNYTNQEMNLSLENEKQVYIAVFDIPLPSDIIGFQTQTLALLFGLNTHIYHGSGSVITGLEENPKIKKAMQSLFVSIPQVLPFMKIKNNTDFYNSENVRAYLKTKQGIYFKELEDSREDKFIRMLMENVLKEISMTKK